MSTNLALTDLRILTAIVCQGRVLVDGESVGEVCGVTIRATRWGNLFDTARVAGWKIGHRADGIPDAMCPRCARPDPATVALCRDLERTIAPAGTA